MDGQAGGITQKSIALIIADRICITKRVPREAARGQLEHESAFRLGIYSPPRPDDNYDAGVAQRNTQFTPAHEGFHVQKSILALMENTRKHFDLFVGVTPARRRWTLAQGAWNAPAFACYIAREEGAVGVTPGMVRRPSEGAREIFETYMSKVSKYLTV